MYINKKIYKGKYHIFDMENKIDELKKDIKEVSKKVDILEKTLIGICKGISEKIGVNNHQNTEAKDSIKVTHNSKGTNWEIKLIEKEGRDFFTELDKVETQMKKRYS